MCTIRTQQLCCCDVWAERKARTPPEKALAARAAAAAGSMRRSAAADTRNEAAAGVAGQAYVPAHRQGPSGSPPAKRQRKVSQRMQEAMEDGDDPDLAAFATGMVWPPGGAQALLL